VKLTSYTNYALRSLQLAALNAPSLVRIDDVVKIHGLAKLASNKAQLLNRIAPLHPLDQLDHGTPPDYNKKSA